MLIECEYLKSLGPTVYGKAHIVGFVHDTRNERSVAIIRAENGYLRQIDLGNVSIPDTAIQEGTDQ